MTRDPLALRSESVAEFTFKAVAAGVVLGVLFGAAMALLYGLMYVLLQREQTALVIGSVGLFTAVAAVMWLTRRVDWYRLFEDARAAPEDGKAVD